eukprot:MONOS_5098.1-p1 / transcript=MONOS_5098.1 / gene=MONOS_5098 / organism=Monocercomonoides_exilis_PA203 / gene_product=unspecified product / transcript_product=unspecified product / location=Mono_scaffold00144:95755-97349(+) / protein_length=469 / sequence_SO=supercontig / SO=protein_coding / is_pseudo=false
MYRRQLQEQEQADEQFERDLELAMQLSLIEEANRRENEKFLAAIEMPDEALASAQPPIAASAPPQPPLPAATATTAIATTISTPGSASKASAPVTAIPQPAPASSVQIGTIAATPQRLASPQSNSTGRNASTTPNASKSNQPFPPSVSNQFSTFSVSTAPAMPSPPSAPSPFGSIDWAVPTVPPFPRSNHRATPNSNHRNSHSFRRSTNEAFLNAFSPLLQAPYLDDMAEDALAPQFLSVQLSATPLEQTATTTTTTTTLTTTLTPAANTSLTSAHTRNSFVPSNGFIRAASAVPLATATPATPTPPSASAFSSSSAAATAPFSSSAVATPPPFGRPASAVNPAVSDGYSSSLQQAINATAMAQMQARSSSRKRYNGTGVPPSVLSKIRSGPLLKKHSVKPESDVPETVFGECTICLDSLKVGAQCTVLSACNHVFHTECIIPWLSQHKTCPICRSIVQSRVTATKAPS